MNIVALNRILINEAIQRTTGTGTANQRIKAYSATVAGFLISGSPPPAVRIQTNSNATEANECTQ